ncbi:tetratricopeptide repeat protein [Kitasatospora sp. NPDC002227]|uniref:tetratricopeptide repeat protein n=1 Tax=Kitasatospora sp. NPDC002227 TaxID=3154773 RepID=UPI00332B26B5
MFAGLLGGGKKRDLQRADELRLAGIRFAADESWEQAEQACRQAAELRTARLGAEAPLTLQARGEWAQTLPRLGRRDEAVAEFRDLVRHCPAVMGEDQAITCEARICLANLLLEQGSPEEALSLLLAVLGRRAAPDKFALKAWDTKLRVWSALGRHREAADEALELRAQYARVHGDDHILTLRAGANRVQNLVHLGEYEQAECECDELIELHEGKDLFWQAVTNARVLALNGLGRHERAEATARAALEQLPKVSWPGSDMRVTLTLGLARSLSGSGRGEEALAAAEARAEFQREADRRVALAAPVATVTAQVLLGLGRLAEAEAEARQAADLAEAHLTPRHHATLEAETTLGSVLAAQGRSAEAAEQLTRCAAAWREYFGPRHPRTVAAEAELAALG